MFEQNATVKIYKDSVRFLISDPASWAKEKADTPYMANEAYTTNRMSTGYYELSLLKTYLSLVSVSKENSVSVKESHLTSICGVDKRTLRKAIEKLHDLNLISYHGESYRITHLFKKTDITLVLPGDTMSSAYYLLPMAVINQMLLCRTLQELRLMLLFSLKIDYSVNATLRMTNDNEMIAEHEWKISYENLLKNFPGYLNSLSAIRNFLSSAHSTQKVFCYKLCEDKACDDGYLTISMSASYSSRITSHNFIARYSSHIRNVLEAASSDFGFTHAYDTVKDYLRYDREGAKSSNELFGRLASNAMLATDPIYAANQLDRIGVETVRQDAQLTDAFHLLSYLQRHGRKKYRTDEELVRNESSAFTALCKTIYDYFCELFRNHSIPLPLAQSTAMDFM